MQWLRMRLTVFRLLLGIAISAIGFYLALSPLRERADERFERCLQIADSHARLGAEYLRNARGNPQMLRTAAWHEHMRREFEQAAREPQVAVPRSRPAPPQGWMPPAIETTAGRS